MQHQSTSWFLVTLLLALTGCTGGGGGGGTSSPEIEPAFETILTVTDTDGNPIATAVATPASANGEATLAVVADGDGRVRLERLREPQLLIVSAPGFLSEPVVVERSLAGVESTVSLLSETGPAGERRLVIHFAGDAMLGRRYIEPTQDVTAVVTPGDGGASARAVVAPIAPLFSAAHVRSINLETVVGDFTQEEAYPEKRFLLLSPAETMDMLDELGASFVTLGNNHTRDWLDIGAQVTVDALDNADMPFVGGGATVAEASAPLVLDTAGYRLGLLSYTSVNGDFVNDNLPDASVTVPEDLAEKEAWQYEERSFGFTGASVTIPTEARRIGSFWQLFEAAEDSVATEAELGALWTAAEAVYPELQDWVARRGHGGANPYISTELAGDITDARATGADLVIVQFHSGFQFQEVKSSLAEAASHRAIDAGADLVVCHHPHVLQGLEWYKGKLIAYSLGNFVFDQDFLSTFGTAVLRTVFQEGELIEARLFPAVLDRYRPTPLGGRAGHNVLQTLYERSVLSLRSERIEGDVRVVQRAFDTDSSAPTFVFERNTARIIEDLPTTQDVQVEISNTNVADLPPPQLTRSRGPTGDLLPDVLLGRDLFRWGNFEDYGADGQRRGGTHWATGTNKRVEILDAAPSGVRCLRIDRRESHSSRIIVRPVARVTMARNRMFSETAGEVTPVDGEPSYSVRLQARISGSGEAGVQFTVYHFDDTNPTEDPESQLLRTREYALPIPNDDEWHEVLFDVPDEVFSDAGLLPANAFLIYLTLRPPVSGRTTLRADDLQFIEWRAAGDLPDGFYGMDAARGAAGAPPFTIALERTAD